MSKILSDLFKSEFFRWLAAVFGHWIGRIGCAGIAAFQLLYGLWRKEPPPVITWGLLFGCFCAASFLAWLDEHRKSDQSGHKRERENIRAKLGGFQLEIEERARGMKNLSPIDILTFDKNLNATAVDDQFIEGVMEYVMQNVGAAYGAIFLMDAGLPERPISIIGNHKHQQHLQYLQNRALRLKQIIDEYKPD